MQRRTFVKCMAAGAGFAAAPAAVKSDVLRVRDFGRVQLVDSANRPFKAEAVLRGPGYVFHYPYISTPCFLLRLPEAPEPMQLETEDGEPYEVPGGVGGDGNIVAYSAICAHQMAHPTQRVSYISYRPDVREYGSGSGVISCCAEHSVYDPARGAEVLWGPAPQPLAAVLLEHDPEDDALHAVGMAGGTMFRKYFDEYGERLRLEYRTMDPGADVGETTLVQRMQEFTENVIRCPVDPSAPEEQQDDYTEQPWGL